MPVHKRKPVEANDGSYGGKVLAAFDAVEVQRPSCKLAKDCGGTGWRECETDEDHVCGLGEPCFGCDECEEGV